jgi:hypothetical protein
MRRAALLLAAASSAALSAGACARGEPPSSSAPDASPSVAPLPASLSSLPLAAAPTPPPSASVEPASSAPASTEPGKLPQTRDKPEGSGPAFDARVAALWDAIVSDVPERAMGTFFPVDAYAQIKDVPNPGADWKGRLVAAYKRDIHAFHQRLGAAADRARFASFEVGDRPRWVNPHEELNTGGYWRVFDSKLRYQIDGKDRVFAVASLISWRGEWYVVHLGSIK